MIAGKLQEWRRYVSSHLVKIERRRRKASRLYCMISSFIFECDFIFWLVLYLIKLQDDTYFRQSNSLSRVIKIKLYLLSPTFPFQEPRLLMEQSFLLWLILNNLDMGMGNLLPLCSCATTALDPLYPLISSIILSIRNTCYLRRR